MILFVWTIFEAAISIFEIVVYFDFYNHLFARNDRKRLYLFLLILLCAVNSFVSITFNTPLILLINFCLINLAIVNLLFDGNILYKTFSVALLVALGLLSEILAAQLIALFGFSNFSEIFEMSASRIAGIATSKIIFFAFIKSIERFRKDKTGEIMVRNWLMLMLIPIISILIIHQIAYSITQSVLILPLITICGILYINFAVFGLFEMIMRQSQREIQYKMMGQQLESQANYYKSLSESRTEIRKVWHDLKNHVLCLYSMARDGDLLGIREYIDGMNILVNETAKTIDTGNPAIDAVLNEKRAEAIRKQIQIDFEVAILPNTKIDPIDACILLGNSLDNALEACFNVVESDRRIHVKFIQKDSHLLLNIINTTNGVLKYERGTYQSTKSNASDHGFGLLNIQTIVEKHKGNLMLDCQNNQFSFAAILQINE